mmetsp:Transcript_31936/g.68970  ORF Transcript_31936/g.68970 Transcript_31936/m.68970 type:complete len:473 (+) Transcript_31936:60-1478(+)
MKSISINDDIFSAATVLNRDLGHAAAFPMPTEAKAMDIATTSRQASTAVMLSHSPITQNVSNSGIRSNGDDSARLSILIKQHHLRSMSEQLKSVRAFITANAILSTGGIPDTTAGTRITTATNNDVHQDNNSVAANPSADSNYSAMLRSQIDLSPANAIVDAPQSLKSRSRKPNFAEKLHTMLSSRECRDAVKWIPSGRAFCIVDQNEFVKTVMPKFFRGAKFDSFVRRLKRWGFEKDCSAMGYFRLNRPVYRHGIFCRDRPELCKIMNGKTKDVSTGQVNQLNVPGRAPVAALLLSTQNQKHFFETPRFLELQVQAKQHQLQQLRLRSQASLLQHEIARQQVARQQQVNNHLAKLTAASRLRDYRQYTSSYDSPQCTAYSELVQNIMTLCDTTSPENTKVRVHPVISKSNDLIVQSMSPTKVSQADLNNDIDIRTEEQLVILRHLQELKKKTFVGCEMSKVFRGCFAPASA